MPLPISEVHTDEASKQGNSGGYTQVDINDIRLRIAYCLKPDAICL